MKIICIGRNYAEHARELKNEVPTQPVIFLKPPTSLLRRGQDFYIPDFSNDVHYEAELVLKINRQGKHIKEKFAHKYYSEITVGIDFTARDLQQKLKEKGLPWELAKGFDGAAAVGEFVNFSELRNKENITFSLNKNGEQVQLGQTNNLLFSFDKLIEFVSGYITLQTGDLVFTGTPAGVGPVAAGDELTGFLEDNEVLQVKVK